MATGCQVTDLGIFPTPLVYCSALHADGAIMIFVELDDAALPALVETVKKSSARLQKELARRG